MKNWGGHFTPELGGHFELELGGQYHWNLHYFIGRRRKVVFYISPVFYQHDINGYQICCYGNT